MKRFLAEGALAVATGLAASWLVRPFGPLGGLALTIRILPLVGWVFHAVAARTGGGAMRAGESALWAAWVPFALGGSALGLPFGGELAFGGLLLLLALRLSKLVPALARILPISGDGRGPEAGRAGSRTSPLWPFFLLPLALYSAILPWSHAHRAPDGDEPYYLLLARSLSHDFDTDLANEYKNEAWREFSPRPIEPQPGDPRGPQGEVYSRHEPLLPLLLAPFYAAGGTLAARFAMTLLSAALAAAIFALARRRFEKRPATALLVWSVAAFAPPLLTMSHQVWVEVPAALAMALALDRIERLRTGSTPQLDASLLALCLVILPLLKLRLLVVAGGLAALAAIRLFRSGRRREAIGATATLALFALGVFVANSVRFGRPLKMQTLSDLDLLSVPFSRIALGGSGLFFDVAFGLFAFAPVWLATLPGAALALRRRALSSLAEILAVAPYLLLVASRREWYGGGSPPFRYGVALLPALALLLGHAFEERRRTGMSAIFAIVVPATFLLALLWLVVPGWTYPLADGTNQLLHWVERFSGADFARFFPSSVRPRAATWIVPLLAVVALSSAGLVSRRWRFAPSLGLVLLLGAYAGLAFAARHVATSVVEYEDDWVAKTGGELFPGPWTIDRTRVAGGWLLPRGTEARAPLVAGGRRLVVEMAYYYLRHDTGAPQIVVLAGARELARFAPEKAGEWLRHRIGPVDWNAGEPLVARIETGDSAGPRDVIIFDRAELSWQ